MAFTLTSPAFSEGGDIPIQYTCDGAGRSPELAWRNAPVNARSFALILHDPDSPKGDFTHWVLFDIPEATNNIPAGVGDSDIGVPGLNDFGNSAYGGPCPGQGKHRYVFDLYALDTDSLGLFYGASRASVEAALQGHVLDQAHLMGRYERRHS